VDEVVGVMGGLQSQDVFVDSVVRVVLHFVVVLCVVQTMPVFSIV